LNNLRRDAIQKKLKKLKNKKVFFLPFFSMYIFCSGNSIQSAAENEGGRKKLKTLKNSSSCLMFACRLCAPGTPFKARKKMKEEGKKKTQG
jgi:hypothetical protein